MLLCSLLLTISYAAAVHDKDVDRECGDSYDKCTTWAVSGECSANEGWMRANCRKSCESCETCYDQHVECVEWSERGECDANSWWMTKNCRRSCLKCHKGGLKIDFKKRSKDCKRKAEEGDVLSYHYIGTLEKNGKKFDSSYDRDAPYVFTMGEGQVIEGVEEGLVGVCAKDELRLVIPAHMAYGEKGTDGIPGGATIAFDIVMVDIKRPAEQKAKTAKGDARVKSGGAKGPETTDKKKAKKIDL